MRGYFDGDGSWYVGSSKKTSQIFFSTRGTPEFLTVYRSILERYSEIPKKGKPIRVSGGIGVLEYGGNGVASKIRDFLYRDANIYLERKYDIVKNVVAVKRFDLSSEILVQKMKELGEQKMVAKVLGCSTSRISGRVKELGIRDKMKEARLIYLQKEGPWKS